MATTTLPAITFNNYADMLCALRDMLTIAAGVEGASDIGAFFPIAKPGESRGYGNFSDLSEWLDDVADALQDFLAENGEELEGWDA